MHIDRKTARWVEERLANPPADNAEKLRRFLEAPSVLDGEIIAVGDLSGYVIRAAGEGKS